MAHIVIHLLIKYIPFFFFLLLSIWVFKGFAILLLINFSALAFETFDVLTFVFLNEVSVSNDPSKAGSAKTHRIGVV